MANVQFDEENQYAARSASGTKSKMAAKLISLGLVKNERQASYLLIGVVLASLSLGVYIISIIPSIENTPSPEELSAFENMPL